MLISASVTISAVNDIEDYGTYQHADEYKGAAAWMVLVSIVAIVYHGITIFIRILYYSPSISRYYSGFAITVSDNSYMLTTVNCCFYKAHDFL